MPRTKKTTEPKTKKPVSGLELTVLDTEGKEAGSITLSKEIFNAKINKPLMEQAVRVFLANQRQGTVQTKTRGDVSGGGKKPWKQKGTGRARQGSTRAPHWKGGGVAFGPMPRDYSLELSDKMKKLAFFSSLTSKLKDSKIKIISDLDNLEGKTKNMAKALKAMNITGTILLALPKDSLKIVKSVRNIENLEAVPANLLNTHSVIKTSNLIFLKSSMKLLEETFLGKND
jgi:large subunit ribosomal protein L4